ncbi:hypothetical protein S40288_11594, partial [Stachybotrys chartarum IBT 40288]
MKVPISSDGNGVDLPIRSRTSLEEQENPTDLSLTLEPLPQTNSLLVNIAPPREPSQSY